MKSVCLNPHCHKPFKPSHYGRRQKVCSGEYLAKCSRKCVGAECRRCGGKSEYVSTCSAWYKSHWTRMRKPPRGIVAEDFAKILKACEADVFHWSMVVTARETGLRKGELLGLSWRDVFEPGTRDIKRTVPIVGQWDDRVGFKTTKTDSADNAMFSKAAREAILKLLAWTMKHGGIGHFNEKRLWPVSESHAYTWFIQLQERLGIRNPETGEEYRFHDLRHCVGVELVRAGRADLAQKMLRHRNIQTTMGYSERTSTEILDEVEVLRAKRRSQGK